MASDASDFPFGIMDVVELLALRKRRPGANSVYVDCPFCGDGRGKMNVNYVKNAWRCNYCGESGGMLSLYAKINHVSNSDAYREICDALTTGETSWGYENHSKSAVSSEGKTGTDRKEEIPQSSRASDQEIHQTYSLMLEMLSVVPKHMKHVNAEFDILLDEADVDAILEGKETVYGKEIVDMVLAMAEDFVEDLFNSLREKKVDPKSGVVVFVGGGGIRLKKVIEASDKIGRPFFVEDINANAKGYELLYHMEM